MKSKSFPLRDAILFAFMLFFLPGKPFAIPAPHQDPAILSSWNLFSNISHIPSFYTFLGMPVETPALADFDGDQKPDIAQARLSNNQYKIIVSLSRRSQVAILNPSVQLTGFTVYACDINNDLLQDIVVTYPTAMHPLAVWLGDGHGNFEVVDQNLFENRLTFAKSSKYQNNQFLPDQNDLDESPDRTCEKPTAFDGPRLKHTGFIINRTHSGSLRILFIAIALRSPPNPA